MKYKWLLLDADGTLFDYEKAEAKALAKTFEAFGQTFRDEYLTAYRQINGQIWLDYEQGLISAERIRARRFELLGEAIRATFDAEAFGARYLEHLAEASDLTEDAERVVRDLHGKVGMVVLTNGLREVQRKRLAGSTLREYVEDIVVSGEVGASKPDPRIFDAAFEVMGSPGRADVLMVGDGLTSDIAGGQAYGIDTCWVNPQGKPCTLEEGPTYEIRGLAELPGIVAGDASELGGTVSDVETGAGDGVVSLREITAETVLTICKLSDTLSAQQNRMVAPNAVSIAQAHFSDKAWFRAIYAGEEPVGFIMLYDDPEEPTYFLWRLMLAGPHQRKGYGRKAVDLLVDYVRSRPGATELLVSWEPIEGGAEPFYRKLGFEPTGEIQAGEVVGKLDLRGLGGP